MTIERRMTARRTDVTQSWWEVVVDFFVYTPMLALEFYMGVLACAYGVWLLLPWPGYDTSPTWSTFAILVPDERVLSAMYLVPGVLQTVFAVMPRAAGAWPKTRLVATLLLCVVWSLTLWSFIMANWRGFAATLTLVHLVAQIWVTARVGTRRRGAP